MRGKVGELERKPLNEKERECKKEIERRERVGEKGGREGRKGNKREGDCTVAFSFVPFPPLSSSFLSYSFSSFNFFLAFSLLFIQWLSLQLSDFPSHLFSSLLSLSH